MIGIVFGLLFLFAMATAGFIIIYAEQSVKIKKIGWAAWKHEQIHKLKVSVAFAAVLVVVLLFINQYLLPIPIFDVNMHPCMYPNVTGATQC